MRRAVGAVAAALAFLSASPADAYCRSTTNSTFVATDEKPCDDIGKPLFWGSKCVGYDFQRDVSVVSLADAERAAASAFVAWSDVRCPTDTNACAGPTVGRPAIATVNLGPVACSKVEYNQDAGNANVIIFREGVWPHGDIESSVALTSVHFDRDSGEIYDADIEINARNITTTDDPGRVGYDLGSILAHETGHFLGLAHAQPGNVDSVMHSGYVSGRIARTLAADDACGICAIYPPSREATCDPKPRHGFASECDGQPAAGVAPATWYAHGGGCAQSRDGSGGSAKLAVAGLALAVACAHRRRGRRKSSMRGCVRRPRRGTPERSLRDRIRGRCR